MDFKKINGVKMGKIKLIVAPDPQVTTTE